MNRISLLAAMLVVGASVQVVSAAEAAKETATQPFGGATGGVIKRAETAAQPFGGATGGVVNRAEEAAPPHGGATGGIPPRAEGAAEAHKYKFGRDNKLVEEARSADAKAIPIEYFHFGKDFKLDTPQVLRAWGVPPLQIQQGTYRIGRIPGQGGKTVLTLAEPLNARSLKLVPVELEGGAIKGGECADLGAACFYNPVSTGNSVAMTLTPIVEQGRLTKIEVQYKGAGSPKQPGF